MNNWYVTVGLYSDKYSESLGPYSIAEAREVRREYKLMGYAFIDMWQGEGSVR